MTAPLIAYKRIELEIQAMLYDGSDASIENVQLVRDSYAPGIIFAIRTPDDFPFAVRLGAVTEPTLQVNVGDLIGLTGVQPGVSAAFGAAVAFVMGSTQFAAEYYPSDGGDMLSVFLTTYRRNPLECQALVFDGDPGTIAYLLEHYPGLIRPTSQDGFPLIVELSDHRQTRINVGDVLVFTGSEATDPEYNGVPLIVFSPAQFEDEYQLVVEE